MNFFMFDIYDKKIVGKEEYFCAALESILFMSYFKVEISKYFMKLFRLQSFVKIHLISSLILNIVI